MMLCRAVLLVAVPLILPLYPAAAQFGGMPGMPGAPGFGPPPPQAGPPPACQQLLALRDEVQKHGQAIEAANKRHATATDACKLFKAFLGSESKFIKSLDSNQQTCGVPPQAIQQAKASHVKAEQIGKQVCEAAASGAGAGPSLSDALGTTPAVPDATTKTSRGGAFDTLTGNALQR